MRKDELWVPGLNVVLEDLEKEHTRAAQQLERAKVANKNEPITYLEAQTKLDLLERLLHRYKSWL